jgi:putative ABC transport system permease protein
MKKTALCTWWELKRYTLIILVGFVLLSVAFVTSIFSFLQSQEMADRNLKSTESNFIAYLPSCGSKCCLSFYDSKTLLKDEGFFVNGIATNLFSTNFLEDVLQLPEVKDASSYLLFQFREPADGCIFTIGGFDPGNRIVVGATSCAPRDVPTGRFLIPGDNDVVMIDLAYALFKKIWIGDYLAVAGDSFKVVGIVNAGKRQINPDIYMVFSDAERTINKHINTFPIKNQANILLVEAKNTGALGSAIKSIKTLFPSLEFLNTNCAKPAAQIMRLSEVAEGK